MGINVQLRTEGGELLAEVLDSKMTLSRAAINSLSGTRLLKYLMPYGDAVFNQLQAGGLAMDIRDIKEATAGTPLADLLAKVEPLIERLAREVHLYLWFVGD